MTASPRARAGLGAAAIAALFALSWVMIDRPAAGTGPQDRTFVLALLKAGRYDHLDRHIGRLQEDYERRGQSEAALENAYAAFASADPELQARLDAWIDHRPRSYAARLARGEYYRHLARIALRNEAPAAADGSSSGALQSRALQSQALQSPESESRALQSRAREDLEAAVRRHPSLGIAYAALVGIAMAESAGDEADRVYRLGRQADPGSAALGRAYLLSLRPWQRPDRDPVALMAKLHELSEDLGGADGEAANLAALRGFHAYVTAELLRRQRRHDQAGRYYRDALAQGSDWLYLRGAGMNALQSAQAVAAVGYFSEALDLRPQHPTLLDWRAHALLALGNHEAALADWRLALVVDPANPDVLYGYSRALRNLGQAELAAETIDAAPAMALDNPRLRSLRGRMLLADLNRPAEAVADLRSAVELDPEAGASWRAYAEALYLSNDCEGAAEAILAYRRLCANGTTCAEADLAWAERTLRETRDPDLCPVYGILGP